MISNTKNTRPTAFLSIPSLLHQPKTCHHQHVHQNQNFTSWHQLHQHQHNHQHHRYHHHHHHHQHCQYNKFHLHFKACSSFIGCNSFSSSIMAIPTVIPMAPLLTTTITMKKASQQETEWNPFPVLTNDLAAPGIHLITVDVGEPDGEGSLQDNYLIPGQYVKLRTEAAVQAGQEKPGFFAITSPPNVEGRMEFLVKDLPEQPEAAASWLCKCRPGDIVQISPIQGNGFPILQAWNQGGDVDIPDDEVITDVLLFANGTGIAPIRAAIESYINGVYPLIRRSVILYYGCKTMKSMAYQDRFKLWEECNVKVVPVYSRGPDNELETQGKPHLYVQHVLKEQAPVKDPKKTGALLCGVKDMSIEVKQYLIEQGVPEKNILSNF